MKSKYIGEGKSLQVGDRIQIIDYRLSIGEIVSQLKSYNCPEKITEQIEEWILDLYLDREKLRKWKESI